MIPSNHESGPVGHGSTLQHWFLAAAVTITLILSISEACSEASAKNILSSKITIHARVLQRTSMQLISQVPELVITKVDVSRGWTEVLSGSRISVKTNNPEGYLLVFEPRYEAALFRTAIVNVGGHEVQLSGSGWIRQPFVKGGITQNISYRFILSPGAQPGTYPWPLSVSVLPLGGR